MILSYRGAGGGGFFKISISIQVPTIEKYDTIKIIISRYFRFFAQTACFKHFSLREHRVHV